MREQSTDFESRARRAARYYNADHGSAAWTQFTRRIGKFGKGPDAPNIHIGDLLSFLHERGEPMPAPDVSQAPAVRRG